MTRDSNHANSVLWTESKRGETLNVLLTGATPPQVEVGTTAKAGEMIWPNGAAAESRVFPAEGMGSRAGAREQEMTGIREDAGSRYSFLGSQDRREADVECGDDCHYCWGPETD